MSEARRARIRAKLKDKGVAEEEVISGTVVPGSVDEDAMTCSVEILTQDEPIEGVMLNVIESNVKGCVAVPEDGSHVWIISIDGPGEWGIVKTERIKKVLVDVSGLVQVKLQEMTLTAGNSKLHLNNDEMAFNDGPNGGVPINSKIEENFTAFKDYLTSLNTAISSGLSAAASADSTAGATFEAAMQLHQITITGMENPKVKH